MRSRQKLLWSIGDDINPYIKLLIYYPSRHEDRKLYILDLKVRMEEEKDMERD